MAYSVRYDAQRHLVFMHITSTLTISVAKACAIEAADLVLRHNCKSVLTDFRECVPAVETMEIYDFALSLPGIGMARDVRIASVVSKQHPDHRFFETVLKNRGSAVQYFTDTDEALRWLAEQAASENNREAGPGQLPRDGGPPDAL